MLAVVSCVWLTPAATATMWSNSYGTKHCSSSLQLLLNKFSSSCLWLPFSCVTKQVMRSPTLWTLKKKWDVYTKRSSPLVTASLGRDKFQYQRPWKAHSVFAISCVLKPAPLPRSMSERLKVLRNNDFFITFLTATTEKSSDDIVLVCEFRASQPHALNRMNLPKPTSAAVQILSGEDFTHEFL